MEGKFRIAVGPKRKSRRDKDLPGWLRVNQEQLARLQSMPLQTRTLVRTETWDQDRAAFRAFLHGLGLDEQGGRLPGSTWITVIGKKDKRSLQCGCGVRPRGGDGQQAADDDFEKRSRRHHPFRGCVAWLELYLSDEGFVNYVHGQFEHSASCIVGDLQYREFRGGLDKVQLRSKELFEQCMSLVLMSEAPLMRNRFPLVDWALLHAHLSRCLNLVQNVGTSTGSILEGLPVETAHLDQNPVAAIQHVHFIPRLDDEDDNNDPDNNNSGNGDRSQKRRKS